MLIHKGDLLVLAEALEEEKQTLIDLLCGLHVPKSGSIRIDENSLNKINIKKWRSMIGYVPQELFLFHDTIYNNISLNDSILNKKDIDFAIKSAGCEEFIKESDNGLDTIIGEQGSKLSGGQRQRISITRAYSKNLNY